MSRIKQSIQRLGITPGAACILKYVLENIAGRNNSDRNVGFRQGSFDACSFILRTIYPSYLTNKPPDPNSLESIQAYATLVHEWAHFVQFFSTTVGFVILVNRIDQASLLVKFCRTLRKILGNVRLYIPIVAAFEQGLYGKTLQPHLQEFFEAWCRAEHAINICQGFYVNSHGRAVARAARTWLNAHLSNSVEYADTPLTVNHIVEPIARAYEMEFLLSAPHEYRQRLIREIPISTDMLSQAFPSLETALGINTPTSLMLHDFALLIPLKDDVSSDIKWSPRLHCPVGRLLASIDTVKRISISQPSSISTDSYLNLYSEISREIGWPPYHELLNSACRSVEDEMAHFTKGNPLSYFISDLRKGFNYRTTEPEIFVNLGPGTIKLFEGGWQPLRLCPEGAAFPTCIAQAQKEGWKRLAAGLGFQAARAVTVGDIWNCPRREICDSKSFGGFPFPCSGREYEDCHCRFGVELATGGAFTPEEIEWIQ